MDSLLLSSVKNDDAITNAISSGRRPGVVLVLYSSVKFSSLTYCKKRMRAPGVSFLTRGKMHFDRFGGAKEDYPDQTTLLANRCRRRTNVK